MTPSGIWTYEREFSNRWSRWSKIVVLFVVIVENCRSNVQTPDRVTNGAYGIWRRDLRSRILDTLEEMFENCWVLSCHGWEFSIACPNARWSHGRGLYNLAPGLTIENFRAFRGDGRDFVFASLDAREFSIGMELLRRHIDRELSSILLDLRHFSITLLRWSRIVTLLSTFW